MNKSHFIKKLKKHNLSPQEIWIDVIKNREKRYSIRAFSDEAELSFWNEYSKKYDTVPSLYEYAPNIFPILKRIIGENKNIIEIGSGTGKFTIPISKFSKKIIAVDFSKDMLNILKQKVKLANIENIDFINSKYEDTQLNKVDVLLSVNSIYRMLNLKNILKKMKDNVKEKVIIVWTMQRNIHDEILNNTNIKGIERKQEYIHLLNILYDLGIDPNLASIPVKKRIVIDDIEQSTIKLKNIAYKYSLNEKEILQNFEDKLFIDKNKKIIYEYGTLVNIIVFGDEKNSLML